MILIGGKMNRKAFYREIGRRLRVAREAAGLSQKEVGAKLGLTDVGYGNYELGEREIGIARLQEVADILGKPMSYFLGYGELTLEEWVAYELAQMSEPQRQWTLKLLRFLRHEQQRDLVGASGAGG